MGQAIPTAERTILIVEDEAFVRYDLVDFFEEAGFRVFEARDANEAILLLKAKSAVQIAFTDVHMPGSMDGLKLAHYIRHRYPPTLLIVASGVRKLNHNDLPTEAIFVPKPYNPHAVLAAILAAS